MYRPEKSGKVSHRTGDIDANGAPSERDSKAESQGDSHKPTGNGAHSTGKKRGPCPGKKGVNYARHPNKRAGEAGKDQKESGLFYYWRSSGKQPCSGSAHEPEQKRG